MNTNQNSSASSDKDFWEQIQKAQEEVAKAWNNDHTGSWPTNQPQWPSPQPCPSCGHCPTCGRLGRYTITYSYPGYVYL